MSEEVGDTYEALLQFLYRAPIGLIQTSGNGGIEMLNPRASQLLMPLASNGALDNLFAVLEPYAPSLLEMATAHDDRGGVVCESLRVFLEVGPRGATKPQVLSVSLFKIDAARLMFVLDDITLEVEREKSVLAHELEDAARTDKLTGMPNRFAVREKLHAIVDRTSAGDNQAAAIFVLNCDRFRSINDRLGNETGDMVLESLADRLRKALREGDLVRRASGPVNMAARISGDEFVVVLDGISDASSVLRIADRVLDVLNAPYFIRSHTIFCTVSMGIAIVSPDMPFSEDIDALLQDATIATAEAKKQGGARYCIFNSLMREHSERRSALEGELRQAIDKKELFVVYQPFVPMQAGPQPRPIAGVEALVRWRHPLRGIVSPGDFIGIAEECGLIGDIGEFVLAAASRDFVQWQIELGSLAPQLLSVNLSRAQLATDDLPHRVRHVLTKSGMPPHQLQLEVTESLAAQDAGIQDSLKALKSIGVTLALDDFGTGYSSLACLHLLPVDTVKIDRSFVEQVDTSSHHRVLVEATIRVAHSLGMDTVAEGIETQEQAAVLAQLDCEKGQGYLYSKPLSVDGLRDWVKQRSLAMH